MADPLSPEISDRICKHMNEDHGAAIVLYAQAFSAATTATSAQMISIDPDGMNLLAQVNGEAVPVRIPFDPPLADSEAAHHHLIELVKQARQKLQG